MKSTALLQALREKNKEKKILTPHDPEFSPLGRLVRLPERETLLRWAEKEVDPEGPVYIAHYESWDGTDTLRRLEQSLYGSFPAQIGSCCGMNTRMNGMEFHKGHEVILALTPLVLILGHQGDVRENRWDSSLAEFYFLDAGEAVELYSATMHLAPCRVDARPFRSLIILPRGTNQPLDYPVPEEDPLLFMTNKWLVCHPGSPAAGRGAVAGIAGENWEIRPLE